jgi:hypothetical protein
MSPLCHAVRPEVGPYPRFATQLATNIKQMCAWQSADSATRAGRVEILRAVLQRFADSARVRIFRSVALAGERIIVE